MSLEAIDKELNRFKEWAGAPREIRLGCSTVSHEHLGFCEFCAVNLDNPHVNGKALELMCWRLLALRDKEEGRG